jgi:inner membrane protein
MDPVTQGCLAAAFSEAFLFPYDKKRAWIAGGLAGMAPDLDILIRSSHDPLLSIVYHRHFTHALAFIPIGALLVALTLFIFKPFRRQWHWVLIACLIGYASHGPLDALTSYGTVLFWPFSNLRVSLDTISIIDPLFTFPLALGLIWTLAFNQRKAVIYGLITASLVLCFNSWQHQRVILAVNRFVNKHKISAQRVRAFPALASSSYWRVLFQYNHQFVILDINAHLFGDVQIKHVACFPRFYSEQLPEYIKQSPTLYKDYKRYQWFTDGYLITQKKSPLQLADGRYIISKAPYIALWGIVFKPDEPHVNKLRLIELETENDHCFTGNGG